MTEKMISTSCSKENCKSKSSLMHTLGKSSKIWESSWIEASSKDAWKQGCPNKRLTRQASQIAWGTKSSRMTRTWQYARGSALLSISTTNNSRCSKWWDCPRGRITTTRQQRILHFWEVLILNNSSNNINNICSNRFISNSLKTWIPTCKRNIEWWPWVAAISLMALCLNSLVWTSHRCNRITVHRETRLRLIQMDSSMTEMAKTGHTSSQIKIQPNLAKEMASQTRMATKCQAIWTSNSSGHYNSRQLPNLQPNKRT